MDFFLNRGTHMFGGLFFLILVWSLFWKGLALWHSSRRNQSVWFIIFLVISTIGVLEIIYLFLILKLKGSELFSSKKEKVPKPDVAN